MNEAEQVEPLNELDQKIEDALKEDNEESAPQLEEVPAVETPKETAEETQEGEKPKIDGTQKRINKITADKWEATRRAEAAEAKLAEMQATQAPTQTVEPKLEDPDIDFDEAKYTTALIDFKVNLKAESLQKQQQDKQVEQAKTEAAKKFADNCATFGAEKTDFNDVLGSVPVLQPSVLQELMTMENGPELAYFLGNNQDIANNIARMNPVAAGIKIGEISRKLSEPKQIKPSSAPEPIEPVSSGGVVETDIGEEMSMDAWMTKYNP